MEPRISKVVLFDPVIVSGVDTWMFNLNHITEEEVTNAILYLDLKEQLRAQQFAFDQHRNHFIMRRVLLKIVLGQYAKVDPKDVRISYGQYQKPYLENHELIYFNCSYTDANAILAIAQQGQIGIDIEPIRLMEDRKEMLNQFAAANEREWVGRSLKRFLILWTSKEALIKCQGTGFLVDQVPSLDQLPVEIEENVWGSQFQACKIYSKILNNNMVSICC